MGSLEYLDGDLVPTPAFLDEWAKMTNAVCHLDRIWSESFVDILRSPATDPHVKFQHAASWALNMVSGSYWFPSYVAALASRAAHDVVRHGLLENAWDESGGVHHKSRSHYWLAVNLAKTLGLSERQVADIVPLPAATAYIDEHYGECKDGSFDSALGMISLIEEFTTPEFSLIFKALVDSVENGGGIPLGRFLLGGGSEYFTANISDDERHREEMPRLVYAHLMQSGADLSSPPLIEQALSGIKKGMEKSIALRGRFFDGIAKYVAAGGTYTQLCDVSLQKEKVR